MQHPFINSSELEKKTLEELHTGLSELMNKLTFASRMNHGALMNQLQMVIESYRTQIQAKTSEIMDKQKIKTKIKIKKEGEIDDKNQA